MAQRVFENFEKRIIAEGTPDATPARRGRPAKTKQIAQPDAIDQRQIEREKKLAAKKERKAAKSGKARKKDSELKCPECKILGHSLRAHKFQGKGNYKPFTKEQLALYAKTGAAYFK